MSLFRKSEVQTFHQLHAAAHAVSQNALDVFHQLAADLRLSADQHQAVADQAHTEAMGLVDLRDSAYEAASEAKVKADKIAALVA